MSTDDPFGTPGAPGGPDPSTGTSVLEREQVQEQVTEPGDHERLAHYVGKEKILESALSGEAGGRRGRNRPPRRATTSASLTTCARRRSSRAPSAASRWSRCAARCGCPAATPTASRCARRARRSTKGCGRLRTATEPEHRCTGWR